jgi:hypothetical protein
MVKVVTSKYNLVPGVGCWEVEEVIGEQIPLPLPNRELDGKKRQFVEDSVSQQLSTLLNLTKVPENLKKLNEGLVCSYRTIEDNN